ncbi:MAG TPA: ATP synthase F1 subunit delta [Pirellulales bacterium]|nr:ATP synthase F1 subunit delta [Pirellulales bacterium]
MPDQLTTPRLFSKLPTYDTGIWRTAEVYAEALIAASEKAGKTDEVLQEFDSLIDDVLDKLPKLDALLKSSFVEEDAKAAILKKALGKLASPVFLSFLEVVARHGRMDMLRLMHLHAHEEFNRVRNRVRVMVSTAEPLDAGTEQALTQEIQKRLHLLPLVDKQVRPELIGGMVLRVGDRVYDGSIATQLKRLREQMVTRSINEIQSRRDRFSSAN